MSLFLRLVVCFIFPRHSFPFPAPGAALGRHPQTANPLKFCVVTSCSAPWLGRRHKTRNYANACDLSNSSERPGRKRGHISRWHYQVQTPLVVIQHPTRCHLAYPLFRIPSPALAGKTDATVVTDTYELRHCLSAYDVYVLHTQQYIPFFNPWWNLSVQPSKPQNIIIVRTIPKDQHRKVHVLPSTTVTSSYICRISYIS
ncbi:hypothetical protein F4861DRAFT_525384 [Xylaria intraflava]|nr:hypothetical protein F4861DRAFT_525384 [Xylaria intraflava]